MPILTQGLNSLVTIYKRHQEGDNDIGGSEQTRTPLYSNFPARIGPIRTPTSLRITGFETSDLYDCTLGRPPNYYDEVNIPLDTILVPSTGQYAGQDFVVTAVQDDSISDSPNDFRKHKYLSLKRVREARRVQ